MVTARLKTLCHFGEFTLQTHSIQVHPGVLQMRAMCAVAVQWCGLLGVKQVVRRQYFASSSPVKCPLKSHPLLIAFKRVKTWVNWPTWKQNNTYLTEVLILPRYPEPKITILYCRIYAIYYVYLVKIIWFLSVETIILYNYITLFIWTDFTKLSTEELKQKV